MINAVTGSKLTINLQAENTTFANAFYGVDAKNNPLIVSNSGPGVASITVTVLGGSNALTMNFVSPVSQDLALLYKGPKSDNQLITGFYVLNGTATYAPAVVGTAAAAASPAPAAPLATDKT